MSVWVPKLLPAFEGGTDGDGLPPAFNIGERGSELGPLFGGEWHQEKVVPKLKAVVKAMKSAGVKSMGLLGFCFGAWVGMHLCKEVKFVGCASPHPSAHVEGMVGGDVVALGKEAKCPWAFFPAGDAAKGGDPEIYDQEGDLFKALEEKFPGKNVTKRYAAMSHGWSVRGAIKEGNFQAGTGEAVQEAVKECVTDLLEFFSKRGLVRREVAGLPPLPPPPIVLKKPKFIKVSGIEPEARDLNLMLKSVKCDETDPGKAWDAVLGDDTGVVTFSLRNADHATACKAGSSVRVQNARVLMVKGFIRIIVDKWAILKPADEPLEVEPKLDRDLSAVEYELA